MSWAIAVALTVAALIAAWLFNGLVRARNLVDAAWADIDVQLQRRHDLVPRLVDIVKAYATHEKETLREVVATRDQAVRASAIEEKSTLEVELEKGIQRLVVLAEDYPDLKAADNFAGLSEDLVDIEDHLQFARRFYNGAVRDYNTRAERVPDRFIADGFGFGLASFFQANEDGRTPAEVGNL